MENSSWETLLVGVLAVLVIVWFVPGIRAAVERGKGVEADWRAVLIPLGLVALLVIFLVLAS